MRSQNLQRYLNAQRLKLSHKNSMYLIQSFVEENDARDVVVHFFISRKEHLTVASSVLFGVLEPQGRQALLHAS